ncbi:MAG: helix-turn-helix transcriptional regulator [Bryobacteraceae bacterium]
MRLLHRVPGPPLDEFVALIWACENEPARRAFERILPTGTADLIVNLKEDEVRRYFPGQGNRCQRTSGTVLVGVSTRHQVIDTAEQERVVGACFRPGGALAFFRQPAHETRDTDISLHALWDRAAESRLRERLLESESLERQLDTMERTLVEMWRPVEPHPAVAFALRELARRPQAMTVTAVGEATGLSAKRFIERFKREVGMSPKKYVRILRFRQAVGLAHGSARVEWARLALDCGYYDQSHFVHDFREFAGVTPAAYQRGKTGFENHVKFLQDD